MNQADQHIHRLQNLAPFTIQKLNAEGEPEDWWTVEPASLVGMVILNPTTLHQSILDMGVYIMEWSRHVARAQRIWEIHERRRTVWKAAQLVEGKEKDPKAPQWMLEAAYRQHPDYERLSANVDRAAEAHNCAQAVVDALKAKRDMMRSFVRRGHDGNPEILAG